MFPQQGFLVVEVFPDLDFDGGQDRGKDGIFRFIVLVVVIVVQRIELLFNVASHDPALEFRWQNGPGHVDPAQELAECQGFW